MTPTNVPVSPSLRIAMARVMAEADFRCPESTINARVVHGKAIADRLACPSCGRTLGDYARALDVVSWP